VPGQIWNVRYTVKKVSDFPLVSWAKRWNTKEYLVVVFSIMRGHGWNNKDLIISERL
jgi:hypothetical protein